ncbi:MAG: hypothetical protein SFV32_13170 [Opitutaceae bacterium]|nr:hypothetical protein [Opitutaceae bacterium]
MLPVTVSTGRHPHASPPRSLTSFAFAAFLLTVVPAQPPMFADVEPTLIEALRRQNEALKQQLDFQQKQIEALQSQMQALADGASGETLSREHAPEAREPNGRKVVLSGYASAGWYAGQTRGRFPNDEFRVDEARLSIEAQLLRNAYVYGELILAQREALDESFKLGEFYGEIENVLGSALPDRAVNLRVGRTWIPFGQEYQLRNPMDNPLISHSVTDFWGIDEGVMLLGEAGDFSYAAAIQNGGISRLRDGHSDKSLAARVSWAPVKGLSASASAFTTGKLDAAGDFLSEMWIGNNVFRSIGNPSTTRTFEADLFQLDLSYSWNGGHAGAAVGTGRYRDDDTAADNSRDLNFFQFEMVQTLWKGLYLAGRYSFLEADGGYALAGMGDFEDWFLGSAFTRRIDRLGLGAGYVFSPAMKVKLEYTFENAKTQGGGNREDEDQLAAEIALRF